MKLVHNALVGCDLRDRIRIAASGKVASAFGVVRNLALGADWCNAARSFMMSVGCIQAQKCHTNTCPVGVATQDPSRQKALDVADKSERAYRFHHNTMETLTEIIAAAGLDHCADLRPSHICLRTSRTDVQSYEEAFHFLKSGELLSGEGTSRLTKFWVRASADSFRPQSAHA